MNNLLFFWIFCSFLLAVLVFGLSYFLVLREFDLEKLSPYECGFEPFYDSRLLFDVRFYLVSILYIIFDLEIVFLFPWVSVFFELSIFGFMVMFIFLLILTIGFFYEWFKGALDWE